MTRSGRTRRLLPSTSSLQAFEAVARRLSFTRAAQELNLTQTAISHQVRKLEEALETKLFIRDKSGVRLTDAGREYLDTVRAALTMLYSASERAADSGNENRLSVVSLPAFAVKCLLPALPEFRRACPDIALRLDTVVSLDAAAVYNYDVSIRYGNGDWPHLDAAPIAPEELFPVCSPALLRAPFPLAVPADLAHHTMIKTSSLVLRDEWPAWLAAAGVGDLRFADGITCDLMFSSIQAAVDGLGVVMGRKPLADRDLRDGRLVEPFDIRVRSAFGYYVSSTPEKSSREAVRLFREWLLDTFRDQTAPSPHVSATRKSYFIS